MEWDCTLHVVDDSSLARFAARFLHGLHRDTAFEQQYDASDMIAKVKKLIASDPSTGARALGELALLYVSSQTPHVYCRGFALSLWNDEVMNVALPTEWLGTIESLLPDVVAAYPTISGRIPRTFDQNYCVGPYVAARNVPSLLAHVESALRPMAPAHRARFQALCDVLRVAADRGLAYWEGTDIDVAQAQEDWLTPKRPTSLQVASNPLASPLAKLLAIAETQALVGEHFVLHYVDISNFPPNVTTHPDMQITTAAFTPWNTQFVRMATDRTQRPFRFSYYELPDRAALELELPYVVGLARAAADRMLLLPQPAAREHSAIGLIAMTRDHQLEPVQLPVSHDSHPATCDAMPFSDGSLLIAWDGKAYRWNGTEAPTVIADSLEVAPFPCPFATLPDATIVGAFGGRLLRIDREGQRYESLPIDNVMALAVAADDAIIICEGDNPEGDALKLWWWKTREITQIHPEVFGIDDRPTFAYFDHVAQLVVVARPGTWHAVPWIDLVAMRRLPQDVFAAHRAERTDRESTDAPAE